jgi:O-glycosyl hydrolase
MLKSVFITFFLTVFVVLPIRAATATIDTTKTYQTIEGLGGAIAFYDGWVPAHPYKLEIYTNAFAGLNLSMLRLGDWYRYNAGFNSVSSGEGWVAGDIVTNANRVLGHPVPVYMSSWSPPAFLKSNGQTGNGGTLVVTNGGFAYTNFAQYWYDSIKAYQSNGVSLTWLSIQNEPDFTATYDSCVFHPTEDTVNGTNYASYSKALDATFQRLTNLPSPPKILAPEVVHIHYSDLPNYAATMNSNSFYGVNYHLYGGSTDGTPDGYAGDFQTSTNIFPGKPHFMTEYGYADLMQTACLIHDCLSLGQCSGFNYWSLIWPVGGNGLVQIENPYNLSSWTNAPSGVTTQSHGWWFTPSYWAMKHFSYYIQPGYRRVSASDNDNNVRTSAFLSPDNLRLVVVLINTNATVSSAMNFNFGTFSVGQSSVYQTAGTNTYAGTNTFLALGALTNSQALPPLSITTVVLDATNVVVGAASNPTPTNGSVGVAFNATLSWTAGSNALGHAVYLGLNSNAVAQATTSSPEFQGVVSTTNFTPALSAGQNYFWRVDEIAGINTNIGVVWAFSTVAPSANFILSASDAQGATSFNAIGNWVTNGTLNPATAPPGPGGVYSTGPYILRSPTTGGPFTFAGSSLTIAPGGSLYDKVGTVTMTVNNLTNNGVGPGNAVGGTFTLLGTMYVPSGGGGMNTGSGNSSGTDNRTISCGMSISGPGALTNYSADPNWPSHPTAQGTVSYTGNNSAFTGQQLVINNTVLQAGSQANLGGNPPAFNAAQLLLNNGTFQPLANFALNNPNSGITIGANGGNLQISPGITLTISNPIAGGGNLLCGGGGILQIAGANTATGSLVVSNGTLAVIGNSTFLNSQLAVSNSAKLDVTALAVPLAINNQISLAGNLVAAINKTNVTSLLTANNVVYGGTLTLSNFGPALAYGDTIKLFNASNYSGAFSGISPTTPGTGLLWNTNWISVDGTIFITSTNPALITPPLITRAQLSSLNSQLILSGTNGNAPGTLFYTLATTNVSLPLANWTIIATNSFGSGGGFKCTNNFDSTQPQQFFMIRMP